MDKKEAIKILSRYFITLLIGIPNLYLFYLIFTPLTINLVSLFLSPFYSLTTIGNTIILNTISIELIPACIAGSAYYLLLALNLLTPMSIKTRTKSIIFLILSFLILNVLRISIFSSLALNNYQYFDITHIIFWYAGSTILIILIWFVNIYLFKINKIPVYSDFILIGKALKTSSTLLKNKKGKQK